MTFATHPAATAAAEEIRASIAPETPADAANGLRHAAQVVTSFTCAKRALRQLHNHARFHRDQGPKAEAYLTAATIFARHTGAALDQPIPANVTRLDIAFTAADSGILPGFALGAVA